MTDAEIYLRAAECVAAGHKEYSCNAVFWSDDRGVRDGYPPRVKYSFLFDWPENQRELWLLPSPQKKEIRVLALCFAAAIEQQGGL